MSKLTFTTEQIKILKTNPYVKNASEKSITYSDEFKRHFVSESLNSKTAKQIFIDAGFNPEIIGESRIKAFAKKWRKRYRDNGVLALEDTRKNFSGRPRNTELTPEQQIEKLQAKISVLLFMVLVGILRGNPEGRWGCLWPCPGCNAKVGTVDASASTVPLRLASPETTGSERSHGSTQANTQAEGHFLRQHQITKNRFFILQYLLHPTREPCPLRGSWYRH